MITKLGINPYSNTTQTNNVKKQTAASQSAKTQTDVIEIGSKPVFSATYENPHTKKLNASDIDAIKAEADRNNATLRALVQKLLLKQGKSSEPVAIDKDTAAAAKLAISADGEFGVEAVSNSIVDFAIAIADGDPSKLAELKAGIEQGYAEAEKAWGGALPDICYQTRDAIMKKLDTWAGSQETKV